MSAIPSLGLTLIYKYLYKYHSWNIDVVPLLLRESQWNAKKKQRSRSWASSYRKLPIRGLWQRNDKFHARLTIEDSSTGRKQVQRVPLEKAKTVAQPQTELRKLWNRHFLVDDKPIPNMSATFLKIGDVLYLEAKIRYTCNN